MEPLPFDLPSSPQSLSVDALVRQLQTNVSGLDSQEAFRRLQAFGKNQIEEEKVSLWVIFFRQFKNILIYVLFAAALISILLGQWGDCLVILVVVLLNSLIGFWHEFKADHSIRALKKMTESKARVLRDGQVQIILSSEIVPGDCVFLQEGEAVTADLRLIEDTSLLVDEASLTGESIPSGKDSSAIFPATTSLYDLTNMVFAGTSIVRGMGKAIAVHIGRKTYFAKIAEKASEPSPQTPLTKAIQSFSKKYVLGLITLFLFFLLVGYFQERSIIELSYFLVACLVSAVPEGLPLVMTLVIVIGATALSKKNTLIRVLSSIETLGSATVIACDKTGTITQGKLIVKEWVAKDLDQLRQIAALCNDVFQGSADPIDLALWNWTVHPEEKHKQFPRKWSYPFDAKAMLMAVVHEVDHREILLIKGAYESLRNMSVRDEELDRSFEALLEKGYRVLALGKASWNGEKDPRKWKIQIAGLIGFLDPPKEGVKEAVKITQEARIRVLMLTGDHPMTARSIAQEVGIWKEGDRVITGMELQSLDDAALKEALRNTTVLARILPEHKYRVVKILQENKEVVAVTGDGVNDVPALRAADLGIAMGSGTEAAKSVSEMVITDNNFKVIVNAIQQGRVITENLRKVLYYLVSTSLQEITLIALSVFALLPLPMSAIQILWINLVTDGVQDKFFGFIKEEGDVMKKPPRLSSKKFFDSAQLIRIITFGIGVGVFIFSIYRMLRPTLPAPLTMSIIFTCTATAQWANGIQAQKESEPFFKNIRRSFCINPTIFIGIGAGLVLQLAALYLMPVQFKTVPLALHDWIYPAATFFFAFFWVELRKWIECIKTNETLFGRL